ncbi:MAG: hypothetical protein LBC18_13885 [Opitutaceae bacterium]|jgi:hypothetical protein|nr:hypothetical protein [Opitutaceae bacterium]
MTQNVYLLAEDELGLAVGQKLIAETLPLQVWRKDNAHGYGNLKRNVSKYNEMGRRMAVLMLADLDNSTCPSKMINDWLPGRTLSSGFLFRICVREVEAWLLAHGNALAAFLQISEKRIPRNPETLSDPKRTLINLAQKSPRKIREGLTPIGSATIGPYYNELLGGFVQGAWDPAIAESQAPSLARTRARLSSLATICDKG